MKKLTTDNVFKFIESSLNGRIRPYLGSDKETQRKINREVNKVLLDLDVTIKAFKKTFDK